MRWREETRKLTFLFLVEFSALKKCIQNSWKSHPCQFLQLVLDLCRAESSKGLKIYYLSLGQVFVYTLQVCPLRVLWWRIHPGPSFFQENFNFHRWLNNEHKFLFICHYLSFPLYLSFSKHLPHAYKMPGTISDLHIKIYHSFNSYSKLWR